MAQMFIGPTDSVEMPRCREAFPDARMLGPQQARAQVGEGDKVWVMSRLDGWRELVMTLSQRGAVSSVLSQSPTSGEALSALNAGARGYAHALSPPELLRQMDIVISHQGIWVWPELMTQVIGGAFRALGGAASLQSEVLEGLTERERAVALVVAEGLSNKEVARQLSITERTVKAHLGAIFRKLGIRDRMQLILKLSHQESEVP